MRSADLRQRVTVQKRNDSDDTQGGASWPWSTRVVLWAAVEPLHGRDHVIAQQLSASLTSAVRIRYRDDLSVTDRILWMGRTLQVEAFYDRDGHRDELRLLCSEVQA